jgi:hypothetical protein
VVERWQFLTVVLFTKKLSFGDKKKKLNLTELLFFHTTNKGKISPIRGLLTRLGTKYCFYKALGTE